MDKLILTRHGQTKWNIEHRYQGQTDTELTEVGRTQMVWTAESLRNLTIERIFTSPLNRAKDSAEIVAAGLGLDAEIDGRFMEMDLGKWTGQSYRLGRNGDEWFEAAPHGGETGAHFRGRIKSWLEENASSDGTVLLVVHGLVVQVILSILLEEEFEVWHRRPIKNGALTILSKQDWGWRLEKFNEEGVGRN